MNELTQEDMTYIEQEHKKFLGLCALYDERVQNTVNKYCAMINQPLYVEKTEMIHWKIIDGCLLAAYTINDDLSNLKIIRIPLDYWYNQSINEA